MNLILFACCLAAELPTLPAFCEQEHVDEARSLLDRAMECTRRFDINGAISTLETLADIDAPESLIARQKLAELYTLIGRYDKAWAAYERVLSGDHNDIPAWIGIIECACWAGDADPAVSSADEALVNHPRAVELQVARAFALTTASRFDEAEGLIASIINRFPDLYKAHFVQAKVHESRGKTLKAIESYTECLRMMQASGTDIVYTVASCRRLGALETSLGRYQEAAHWLEQIANIDVLGFDVHYGLGLAYSMMSRYGDADKHLQRALEIDPRNYIARVRYAYNFDVQNRFAQALEQYRIAEGIYAGSADLYDRIGTVAIGLGRKEEAKTALTKAITLGPNVASPFRQLAGLLLEEGRNEEAIDTLEKGLSIDSLDIQSYYMLSQALMKSPDEENQKRAQIAGETFRRLQPFLGKVGHYRAMTNLSPEQVESRVQLAEVYETIDDHEKAVALLTEALSKQPDFFPARKARGRVYEKLGRTAEARVDRTLAKKILQDAIGRLEAIPQRGVDIEQKIRELSEELASLEHK